MINNISLRIVFGLPTLLTMGVTINLQQGTLACSEFQHIFVLQWNSPGKGLTEGVSLDESKSFIPLGVLSNISFTISNHQFIDMDGFDSPIYQAAPSNHGIVHDQFCQGSLDLYSFLTAYLHLISITLCPLKKFQSK